MKTAPLRTGALKTASKKAASLDARLDALRTVRDLGADRMPDTLTTELDALLARAGSRRALSADHTVVGLFGATGSGKSSLLNALVGEQIARSHVRRPTTSEPLAVIWQPTGATALLDWLEVRHRHTGTTPIDARASQLILLDLPDFDSIEATHRDTAERLAGQVDALVWVVDPQKYADAVLHTDFIARHSRHGAITIVVLNQVDLLPASDVQRVLDSLRALLADDGLRGVPVLATSATTGQGIESLRSAIGVLADARLAQAARLEADVAAVADRIPSAGTAVKSANGLSRQLVDRLGVAAGVDLVAGAVAGSYRKRSGQATGWPLVSWILRFRADPLARLGLGRLRSQKKSDPELHRTSMPALNAAGLAQVSLAVRGYADAVSEGLSEPWRAGVRQVGESAVESLAPELDRAIARAPLPTRGSWWWVLFAILQWVSVLSALVGVGWLLILAFIPVLALQLGAVPQVEGWPVTTLLIAGGVLLGILLGLAGAAIGSAVAAHRRRVARKSLLAEMNSVAQATVVEPVAAQLARAAQFSAALGAIKL